MWQCLLVAASVRSHSTSNSFTFLLRGQTDHSLITVAPFCEIRVLPPDIAQKVLPSELLLRIGTDPGRSSHLARRPNLKKKQLEDSQVSVLWFILVGLARRDGPGGGEDQLEQGWGRCAPSHCFFF